VVLEEGIVEPFIQARALAVALHGRLQLVDDLHLDLVRVTAGEERSKLVTYALDKPRLAVHRVEGHDAVVVGFQHTLDRIGKQAPDVLHALLLGALPLHLRPEDLGWAIAQNLKNPPLGGLRDSVSVEHLRVQKRIVVA
jgi:hypothetical protein